LERETHNWESINDDSLVELARQGKQAATDQLFSRHICALRHMAIRFLRNEAEAEDVVQDSLMAAFIHLPQYAGRSQFRTWLFSILLNAARTRVRSRRPDRHLSIDETPATTLPDGGPTPDQAVEIRERREIVRDAVNELSPEFRVAYHLCFVKGFSAREAAALTGVNPETFKVRLFRGKRRLANKLVILNEKRHGARAPKPSRQSAWDVRRGTCISGETLCELYACERPTKCLRLPTVFRSKFRVRGLNPPYRRTDEPSISTIWI